MGRGTSTRPWGWSSTVPVAKLQQHMNVQCCAMHLSFEFLLLNLNSTLGIGRLQYSCISENLEVTVAMELGGHILESCVLAYPGSQLRKAAQADLHAAQFKPPSFIMGKGRQVGHVQIAR